MRRKLERGQELTELAKGSLEYTLNLMNQAFRAQFPYREREPEYWIVETFADHVIVAGWGDEALKSDEFYRVTHTRDSEAFTFAPRDQWEVVELAYQSRTTRPMSVETRKRLKDRGRRMVETLERSLELLETTSEAPVVAEGPWRIKGIGITADVVNANGRRYPARVLEAAVREMRTHLNESAGQGRLLSLTTGESDHPSDKGQRRPLYSEIVVNWDTVTFDGQQVLVEGNLLGTNEGKDIRARIKGGVIPGLSQRGYVETRQVQEGGRTIEEITELLITGYDFTVPGEQSDPQAGVLAVESHQDTGEPAAAQGAAPVTPPEENKDMDPEKLAEFIRSHPEMFQGVVADEVARMSEVQLKALETKIRSALGIGGEADLVKGLTEAAAARRELDERNRQQAVDEAISAATKDLPYGKDLNALFVESIRAARPKTVDEAQAVMAAKRTEYDKIASANQLLGLGFSGRNGVQATAPVLERDLGIPEYARGMHEVTERFVRSGHGKRYNWTEPATVNEIFALKMLARFDELYGKQLSAEAKMLAEAEQASDLNLPYSVNRAIIAQVGPQLVAASVFDFDVIDQSPFYIYYEEYVHESGVTQTVANEAVTAGHGTWVALAHQRLTPGTVVVTNQAGAVTYVEGTDYVIDYGNGRLMALAAGAITDGQALLADYGYSAVRKGELQPIERGKGRLSRKTMEAKADRLADQISSEAIVFSASQIGWDATARTLVMLIDQMRRLIDQGVFRLALGAALLVPNNSGGTWNSGASPADYDDLVRKIGTARVKITNRYYEPTSILMSTGMSDLAANWQGFSQAGKRPDSDLKAMGYVGRLKGLPVIESTEFPDSHVLVSNRQLVAHRVYRPMHIEGPFKSRDISTGKLLAAEEYFAEEYNATDAPVPEKGAYVVIQ